MNIYSERTPYTYLIGWSTLNTWYYGLRFAKDCHPTDLFVKYFTSSKHVKNFIQRHGYPDIIQIRQIFKSNEVDKARIFEHKVLRRLHADHRDDFLNKSTGLSIPSQLGIPKSEETKEKLSNSGKGKHFGAKSEETKQKMRNAAKGKKKSTEYVQNKILTIGVGEDIFNKLTSYDFFIEQITNGISSEQIAINLGVSSTTVLRYGRKLNIKFNRNLSKSIMSKLSNKEFFIKSINAGKSSNTIAKELNIPISTVRRYALKFNIRFSTRPKTR